MELDDFYGDSVALSPWTGRVIYDLVTAFLNQHRGQLSLPEKFRGLVEAMYPDMGSDLHDFVCLNFIQAVIEPSEAHIPSEPASCEGRLNLDNLVNFPRKRGR